MILLICPGCGHYKDIKGLGIANKTRFRCTCCDAHSGTVARRFHYWMSQLQERKPVEQAREETYFGLLCIADQKGYRPGWAAYKFKLLYLQWPRYSQQLLAPYQELLLWVERQKQRYKAERKKAEASAGNDVRFADRGRIDPDRYVAVRAEAISPLLTQEDLEVDL